jgi:cytochrome b
MHSNLEEQENPRIKVSDIGVRIFHWSLVLFYTIAYISEDIELIHVYAGYVVLGLILFRVLWGLIGTKDARFKRDDALGRVDLSYATKVSPRRLR